MTGETKERLPLYVMFMEVSNHMGVLARITSVFHRKLLNIRYLTVVEDQDPHFSHITVWAEGDEKDAEGAYRLLANQEDIHSITFANRDNLIERGIVLVKISVDGKTPARLGQLKKDFDYEVLRNKDGVMVLEFLGSQKEIELFLQYVQALKPLEISRTGMTALSE